MDLFAGWPIDFFNQWFREPIQVEKGASVKQILDALNEHPLAEDEAQDYFMPARRYREEPGRFGVYGENQDLWTCFVYEGQELLTDPPVYFSTCLDLQEDYGYKPEEIINGDHVLASRSFVRFLWSVLGQQICIRIEETTLFKSGVTGCFFDSALPRNETFQNPLENEHAGLACYISPKTLWCLDWAAFLDAESKQRFLETFQPTNVRVWS